MFEEPNEAGVGRQWPDVTWKPRRRFVCCHIPESMICVTDSYQIPEIHDIQASRNIV